jgi:hypothetical protein
MSLHVLIRAATNKYNRFLIILLLLYLAYSFLGDSSIGDMIAFSFFLGGITIVVYQIQHSKRTLRLYVGLVFLAVLLRVLVYSLSIPLAFNHFFRIFSAVILLAFLALSIYLILRELLLAEEVTDDLVKGGICVYFLFGFLWEAMYKIVYSYNAAAFKAASTLLSTPDLVYFSFATLSTVGYGDIIPVSNIARVLANLEGMVGVIYPSVLIAYLVGLYSNRNR